MYMFCKPFQVPGEMSNGNGKFAVEESDEDQNSARFIDGWVIVCSFYLLL